MTGSKPRCDSCKFYAELIESIKDSDGVWGGQGSCHRFPPVIDIKSGYGTEDACGWTTPTVHCGSWCGEYMEKK